MKSISIVIVNWNSGEFLKDCIESIYLNEIDLVEKIIIVDNGSTDNSTTFLSSLKHSNLYLYKLGFNSGFAAACNYGAQKADTEFILFLNPDARLDHNSLSIPLKFMKDEDNSKVGICGVSIFNEKELITTSTSRFPNISNIFFESIGVSKLFNSLGRHMHNFNHKSDREVDQLIGAFNFIRNDLFKKLDGFDERFFVYYEEVDFAYRAKNNGFSSYFLSTGKVYHYGGGVSQKVISRRTFYNLRSRTLFFYKHKNKIQKYMYLLVTVFVEPVPRFIYSILKFKQKGIIETFNAYLMYFIWLLKYLSNEKSS